MNLIKQYIDFAKNCATTDYSNQKSVKLHNKSVNKLYWIAKKIALKNTTVTMDDFIKLLDVNENRTNIWAAVHLLELFQIDKIIEEKALKIIRQLVEGDSAEAIGFKIWLDNYNSKMNN